MAKAKPMNRSRNQLATAYAPESFFTFEGGVGACISHSMPGEPAALRDSTTRNILDRLEQFGIAWLDAGMKARDNQPDKKLKAPILAEQCVERSLLDEGEKFRLPGADKLYFSKPSHMGFTPAPLAFVCRHCELFREYKNLREMGRDLNDLQSHHCISSRASHNICSWEQLDVIFVHWSGGWAAPSPNLWDFKSGAASLNYTTCMSCGSKEFRLNRGSHKIGEWYFYCANTKCAQRRDRWMQRDRDTLEILQCKVGEGRLSGPTEVNMEAIPYRASNAYHVQSELFIDFADSGNELGRLLRIGAEAELGAFIAKTYGFAMAPLSNEQIEAVCALHADCAEDLRMFRSANAQIVKIRARMEGADAAARADLEDFLQPALDSREQVLERLRARRILVPKVDLPSAIADKVALRRVLYGSRFDPFQLSIEHEMLKQARLDVNEAPNGKRPFVSFKRLDRDLSLESEDETRVLESAARERLDMLGAADMGLIREFELCRFSFGYSRMKALPVLPDKRHMNMPVRLRFFEPVQNDEVKKRPIYVVQQANQAIYVRLDPNRVVTWLRALDCRDMFTLSEGQSVGAGALGAAVKMDRFLEALPKSPDPPVYLYLYTLLHSYAHLVMKQISEYSGLDLGSLGEYVFPADLAFVVYRNGTTMDLGNLSAMWRNSGRAMLAALLDPRATQCGTGSLCTTRGGACPDCLMIPETSCIASNKLISRSVLRSIGGRPWFDTRPGSITGYLDTRTD
jgi:hypothetical protein